MRGIAIDKKVSFKLLVSFFMVRSVVAHGQWKMVNTDTERAVKKSQPDAIKILLRLFESADTLFEA